MYPPGLVTTRRSLSAGTVGITTRFADIKPIALSETITTRGNPGFNRGPGAYKARGKGMTYANTDRGGNCDHWKYTFETSWADYHEYVTNYDTWDGMPIFTDNFGINGLSERDLREYAFWHNYGVTSDAELVTLGTNLVSILNPLRPHAGLFQTLIELRREGLPSLKSAVLSNKGFMKRLQGSGDDWLNLMFGLRPLWNDLMSTAEALLDAEQLLVQFRRDAGRLVRRQTDRKPVIVSENTTVNDNAYATPSPGIGAYSGLGKLTIQTQRTRETWFSGAFQYALPAGDSMLAQLQSLNQESRFLLGLSFDPKTIWSVLGWSWLVDWIWNVGPVLESFTQTYLDKSVMAYGYIMSVNEDTESHSGLWHMNSANGGYYIAAPYSRYTYRNFKRRQATPYGFGLTWSGFSPFQLSILASLGISRGRP